MPAYYNEIDPFAAQWLRNLIAAGHIVPGEVDTRSIEDVTSDDLRGFQQCHFFAGIGIWSRALRDAGWPDDRMAWTGSCPCQPFSAAGKGAGFTDERHLWPAWHHLIAECRPPVVFGEQVASALHWLDLVQTDMEAAGYAFGANDLCAAGFGGAHIRQRLYFVGVGDTLPAGRSEGRPGTGSGSVASLGSTSGLGDADSFGQRESGERGLEAGSSGARQHGDAGRMALSDGGHPSPERQQRSGEQRQQPQDGSASRLGLTDSRHTGRDSGTSSGAQGGSSLRTIGDASSTSGADSGLADTGSEDQGGRGVQRPGEGGSASAGSACERPAGLCSDGRLADDDDDSGPQGRPGVPERGDELPAREGGVEVEPRPAHAPLLGRHAVDWLYCRDAKWRPVEPGTFPLADAAPQRVGRLRAYGNGLDLETATSFVGAVMDALGSS